MNDKDKAIQDAWIQFATAALTTVYVLNKAVESTEPMPQAMARHAGQVADAMVVELEKRILPL